MTLSVPRLRSLIKVGLSLVVASALYSTLSTFVHPNNLRNFYSRVVLRKSNSIFELRRPIEVLRPDIQRDDDLVGKTCRFQKQSRAWICRDCGSDHFFVDWKDCPLLQRNNMCGRLVHNNDWDVPQPRKYSYLDPLSTSSKSIISHYIQASKHFEQIPCDERIEDCWDFSKCGAGPMKVYVHHNGVNVQQNKAKRYVDMAAERYPGDFQVVTDAEEACLLVVTCDTFRDFSELQQHPVWNEGRNHFIFEANRCFGAHADRPYDFDTGVHYARASLASSTLMDATIRKGYDIALAYIKVFQITNETYTKVLDTMGQERHWLVAFKGNVFTDWHHVWWTHRWMAAEYWDKKDPEVAVDVTCDIKPEYTDEYDYLSLLTDSTFAFCPGGGATQSYRFTEALGLGAIPVTTPDLLPPFAYDLDWSGCVVQVSEARIVDLPRILREIPREEIVQRQQRCQQLFEKTVGWRPSFGQWEIDRDRTLFMTSLKVWSWRIAKHHAAKQAQKDLEESLFVVSKEAMLD